MASSREFPAVPTSPVWGLQGCTSVPTFYMSIWNANSGPHTCVTNLLWMNHLPDPHKKFILCHLFSPCVIRKNVMKFVFFFLKIGRVCSVCSVCRHAGTYGSQKRVLKSPELELQAVLSLLIWVRGTELWSSAKALVSTISHCEWGLQQSGFMQECYLVCVFIKMDPSLGLQYPNVRCKAFLRLETSWR